MCELSRESDDASHFLNFPYTSSEQYQYCYRINTLFRVCFHRLYLNLLS